MKTAIVFLVFLGFVMYSEAQNCYNCNAGVPNCDTINGNTPTCKGSICVTEVIITTSKVARSCSETCPAIPANTRRECCKGDKCNSKAPKDVSNISNVNSAGAVSYSVGMLLAVCTLHLIKARV